MEGSPPLPTMIWLLLPGIQTVDQMLYWFAIIEDLTEEQRKQAFATVTAATGCKLVMEVPWVRAHEAGNKNWTPHLEAYAHIAERARIMGLSPLWALAVRVQIIIYAEQLSDLNSASRVANCAEPLPYPERCPRHRDRKPTGGAGG